MVRQKDNVSIYKVTTEKRNYYVELIRLQNNYYGTPRFEAHLIRTDMVEQFKYCGAHVYSFTGHYMDEIEEANWIVQYHEKKIAKI